uniref:(northern house mosquito) hypothetical protein n=1 Tax=Culex pipiens TaxID=7175 RepID=A0A8D8P1L4_CULPI
MRQGPSTQHSSGQFLASIERTTCVRADWLVTHGNTTLLENYAHVAKLRFTSRRRRRRRRAVTKSHENANATSDTTHTLQHQQARPGSTAPIMLTFQTMHSRRRLTA